MREDAGVNPSTAIATVLIDELIRQGVREAVLCPGSRSAPLAYALEAADREGRLRLHVRVDERSAAYLALGLAKVTRVPVPVVTTSGTAVANLHPAVLEAAQGYVPMIVLTADRPQELRGTGANQTTDQVKIFGSAARWFHEFGTPERRGGQQAIWRSVIGRAMAEAQGHPAGDPGPVHLNVPLREPLVPDQLSDLAIDSSAAESDDLGWSAEVSTATGITTADAPPDASAASGMSTAELDWPEPLAGRPHGEPWLSLRNSRTRKEIAGGAGIAPVPRTLVVLGDLPDPAAVAELAELADAAGWPIIAEPFGSYRRGRVTPHGPLLLRGTDWLSDNLPERILIGGRVTLDRSLAQLMRNPAVTVEAVTPLTSWPDPGHVVRRVHGWDDIERSRDVVAACVDRAWSARWRSAGLAVAEAVTPIITASWPSGPAVGHIVAQSMPENTGIYLGSSNIARDMDLCRDPRDIARGVVSVGNRGLAGIDGVVSSAIGMALSRAPHPAIAVMGDLTFLHDTNALLIGPAEPRPDLTIVVVNDNGGGIFGTLEPGREALAAPYERIFGTPTDTRIAALCEAHGIAHEIVTDEDVLRERISSRANGIRVCEIPIARSGQREFRAALDAAVVSALS